MKKIFTIIALLFSVSMFAQNNGEAIVNTLKEANVSKFSNYFSNAIDLKFPQKAETKNISKADAAAALSGFFSSNNIKGFDVTSQREMDATMYIAGKLKSDSESYNLTVMLKNGSIITVRIN
ncbi:MAG: DUF4783 domain-containing protein [Parafilimonas sp.]